MISTIFKNEPGVYLIANKVNGKYYIGSSKNLKLRIKDHKRRLSSNKHFNKHLQCGFNKDGEEAFVYYVIEKCSIEQLIEKEDFWIEFYNTMDHNFGYNMQNGSATAKSKATSELLTKALKERWTNDYKEKMKRIFKLSWKKRDRNISKETRLKHAERMKKRWENCKNRSPSKETRAKISNSLKGRKRSSDTCLKQADSLKENWAGLNHQQRKKRSEKLSETNKKRWTPEYRAKMSDIIKKSWEKRRLHQQGA